MNGLAETMDGLDGTFLCTVAGQSFHCLLSDRMYASRTKSDAVATWSSSSRPWPAGVRADRLATNDARGMSMFLGVSWSGWTLPSDSLRGWVGATQ